MIFDDILHVINAGAIELGERLARLGDWGTAGPGAPAPDVHHEVAHERFVDGWWTGAKKTPACAGRFGGLIKPIATVVHTTDMLPDEWDALVVAWTKRAGDGACAHFLIGRDASHGVIQLVPITRNGNHAGGPGNGDFVIGGHATHPNLITTGIEVHCAGGVRLVDGAWRLVEDGRAHGAPLPMADVVPDPQRPGRGWHVVTDYQRAMLADLLDDLDAAQAPLPAGVTKRAYGETPPAYAVIPGARVATHAELDPVHRADPWPGLSGWLRARGRS